MNSNQSWTLVTGGSKRLGAEICKTLASNGYNILVHYNKSQKEALEIVHECKKLGVSADCISGDFASMPTLEDFIVRLTQSFPDISCLVNNVGNYIVGSVLATTPQQWNELFQVNLHAPYALIHSLIGSIKKNQGAIINIGIAGINHIPADLYSTAYTNTKLSLWMLTKSLAKDLASDRVTVNMVSPGYLDNAIDLPLDLTLLPMKRAATTNEVARVVAFLVDKENDYITGQNIEVSGGVRLK